MIAETGILTRTRPGLPSAAPDLQMKCGSLKFIAAELDWEGPGFTFAPVLIQPQSFGYVTLGGNDPRALAPVQPNYLMADTDMQVFLHGIELSRELAYSQAFTAFTKEELVPGSAVKDAADLREFVKNYASTLWPPVGTGRMGRDDWLWSIMTPTSRTTIPVSSMSPLSKSTSAISPR